MGQAKRSPSLLGGAKPEVLVCCVCLPYMVRTSHCAIVYHILYVRAAALHNTIHSAQVHAFSRLKPSQESAMPPAFSVLPTSSCSLSLKLNRSSSASHTYDST